MTWKRVTSIVLIIFFIAAGVAVTCLFLPRCKRLAKMNRERAAMADENRALAADTADLRARQDRFARDPDFVVRTGREAGLVKPGETVFRFTNDPSRAPDSP